jgi:aspartate racemase
VRPPLTLGVLGLNPAATLDFLARVQSDTPGTAEHEQIRVIADLNPGIPDLSTPGSGAGAALAEAAGALRGAGADVLALVSDAAHAHVALIERACAIPVVDMIETAARAARNAGAMRVGVLGVRGALRLYREYLAAGAMGLVSLDSERQQAFVATLDALRAGADPAAAQAEVAGYAAELVAGGAELIIAGAVEIAPALAAARVRKPVIQPAELLARRCVAVCLGLEPAPTVAE